MNVTGFYDGWAEFSLSQWEWMECFDRNFHNLCLNVHMSTHDMDSQQWLLKIEERKTIEKDNRKNAYSDKNILLSFSKSYDDWNDGWWFE